MQEDNSEDSSQEECFGTSGIVSSPEGIPEDIEGEVDSLAVSPGSASKVKSALSTKKASAQYKQKTINKEGDKTKIKTSVDKYNSSFNRPQTSDNGKMEKKIKWLRSLKRLGDTVENEYKIIKRLNINRNTEEWMKLDKSLGKFRVPKKIITPVKKQGKKPCKNCVDLLFRGLGTDFCKKRINLE